MNHEDAVTALGHARRWRTSTRTGQGQNCVEIDRELSGWAGVRDTKLGTASPILAIPAEAFTAFVRTIRTNRFG
ncbi:DUF397 domain-containing protein [Solihabitans fulvus]|uniref:DUF397 domain-containing protein n=1 Tax=Solihabitans fulvus TaxID=1892852 RepID=A0A5B2XP05_9PSEU|nr:DUF397 domain-containing protein [Solihabitans fulvus]KAA2264865.1 DUF397 domain-containing protein [Solihabitans fulvus]